MSRHRDGEEFAIGSDSFLDVIANMVGIMIILIVLTGLRIKSFPNKDQLAKLPPAPAETNQLEQAAKKAKLQWQLQADLIERENQRAAAEYHAAQKLQQSELQRRQSLLTQRSRILEDHKQKLQARESAIAKLEAEHRQHLSQAELELRQIDEIERDLAGLQQNFMEQDAARQAVQDENLRAAAEIAALENDRMSLQADLTKYSESKKSIQSEIDELKDQIEKLQSIPKPAKSWVHYATPLSSLSARKEIQARIMNDRIVIVPMEDLTEMLRNRIFGSDDMSKIAMYGDLGPIGGFRMRYRLKRTAPSLSEQIGSLSGHSIHLAGLEMIAEKEVLGEEVDVAMQSNSQLNATLSQSSPDKYSVTLWVYPESFKSAKTVETWLHERKYEVALRPLPQGAAISASPAGNASRFQ